MPSSPLWYALLIVLGLLLVARTSIGQYLGKLIFPEIGEARVNVFLKSEEAQKNALEAMQLSIDRLKEEEARKNALAAMQQLSIDRLKEEVEQLKHDRLEDASKIEQLQVGRSKDATTICQLTEERDSLKEQVAVQSVRISSLTARVQALEAVPHTPEAPPHV